MSDVKRYAVVGGPNAWMEEKIGGKYVLASAYDALLQRLGDQMTTSADYIEANADLRKRLAAAEKGLRAGCTKPLPDPDDEREPINNCKCRACNAHNTLIVASEHIGKTPHGDNCFLSDHYDGDPGNRCNCGKEAVLNLIDSAIQESSHG